MGRKDRERLAGELERRTADFDGYYSAIWGGRWASIRSSLLVERRPVAYSDNLVQPYYMDEASICTARLLPLADGDRVLDMCAAPGGKTLVLASRLDGRGQIVANDRSKDRRARLDKVLRDHLDDRLHSSVRTTCRDASRWGLYEKDAYDAVLLDAPCSSERHVIASDEHMAMWSPGRPKRLAIEQYALLSSAFMTTRPGGFILYSTCSINPDEDENVIERLFSRHDGEVEDVDIALEHSEKLSRGRIILPDTSGGLGPMYACLIRKT